MLVSEVMLQQTPVARVEPVWREWLARWPTPAALAAATPAEVIRAWGKLGYPRRALRLREAAAAIVERHGGVVPGDVAALEALPGVGTYTARAVACFGYGSPQPVVDTNVRRVVARLVHGRAEAGTARAADLADVAGLAPADPERAVRFSVAVMELGALVCVAGTPRCGVCPVRDRCAWRLAGSPAARRAAPPGAEVRRHRPPGARPAARRPARRAPPGGRRRRWTPPGTTPCSAPAAWTRCSPTAWSSRPTTASSRCRSEMLIR